MALPLMPKATAVWLIDNSTLTFEQIAHFVGMHVLEVSGIADGEVAQGIKGQDPIAGGQITSDDLKQCEADPKRSLKLLAPSYTKTEKKRKGSRYIPLSKRQDRPAAIAWILRQHPSLTDAQIIKLLGTTKATIESIRNKAHWNTTNLKPIDPVALGLCLQIELDSAIKKSMPKDAPSVEDATEQSTDEA